jgi:putative endonuclease
LPRHNSGESKSIRHGIPWKLIGYLNFDSRVLARRKEKEIKKRGIKRWLEQSYTFSVFLLLSLEICMI